MDIDLSKAKAVGDNIQAVIVGFKLVLVIDIDENLGISSSGKTIGVASTGGITKVSGTEGLKLNLYLGRRNPEYVQQPNADED